MLRKMIKRNVICPLLRTYVRNKSNFRKPIFVLGLARSGTSMVAGVLGICGAWLGDTVKGNSFNPKGYFENAGLRDGINKKLLVSLNADPSGIDPLPDLRGIQQITNFDEDILRSITDQGYMATMPWLFKDAKLTLLWPLYMEAFPNARWVIVRRNIDSIIKSCMNTSFMSNRSDDREFWSRWAEEYLARLDELKKENVYWRELWVEDLIKGEYAHLREIVGELGLQWKEQMVREFVSPSYWHS